MAHWTTTHLIHNMIHLFDPPTWSTYLIPLIRITCDPTRRHSPGSSHRCPSLGYWWAAVAVSGTGHPPPPHRHPHRCRCYCCWDDGDGGGQPNDVMEAGMDDDVASDDAPDPSRRCPLVRKRDGCSSPAPGTASPRSSSPDCRSASDLSAGCAWRSRTSTGYRWAGPGAVSRRQSPGWWSARAGRCRAVGCAAQDRLGFPPKNVQTI